MPGAGKTSLIGKKLGAYRIDALLGSGGMGDVYRGVHEALGRPVAIKTLRPEIAADTSTLERFFAEARAVNVIRHENIVEVTDLVSEPGGASYMVMELLEGRTLSQAIREAGRLEPTRAARIAVQIAGAIGAAHRSDIIHRDLKPDNVFLIWRAGTADYVKVLDFGIARLRPGLGGTSATRSGVLIGTPAYMSPEQAELTPVTHAADIYSLGVLLFHMLTGRLPFEGPSMPEVMYGHVAEEPPRIHELAPDVPDALATLVAEMLAKKPADRPPDMAAVRVRLLASVGLDPQDMAEPEVSGPGVGAPGAAADPRASDLWDGATVDASGDGAAPGPEARGRVLADSEESGAPPASTATRRLSPRAAPSTPAAVREPAQTEPGVRRPAAPSAVREPARTDPGVRRPAAPSIVRAPTPTEPGVRRPAAPSIVRAPAPARRRRLLLAGGAGTVALAAIALALAMRASGGDPVPALAASPDAVAAERGSGRAADESALRTRLRELAARHHEPDAPAACQTRDREALGRITRAAEQLLGGAPGSARAGDEDAARNLEVASSQDAEHWHWRAKALLYAGRDPAQVSAAADRALALCSSYAAALNTAGTARFRARQVEDAERLYRQALEHEASFLTARYNLGLVELELGRIHEGIASLSSVLDAQPGHADALLARGQAYLMARDPGAAVADLERATAAQPDRSNASWLLGQAYHGAGRPEDARHAFCAAAALGHALAAERCAR